MTQLAGKVVWVTGASSGIGEGLAIRASRRGAKLVLSARRQAELERVRGRCADPGQVAVLPVDLLQLDGLEATVQAAEGFFGPVDVLANNAGVTQRSTVLDTRMDVYRQIMELDFFATVALTKALLPGMVARKSGHIVTVSSVLGYITTPLRSGYCAAKHALHGFYDALRTEVWRDNVRVTIACPGFVRTNVSINAVTGTGAKHGKMDPGTAKGMDPQDCAERIWRAVERDRDEVMVGPGSQAAWIQRHFPALWSAIIKRVKPT